MTLPKVYYIMHKTNGKPAVFMNLDNLMRDNSAFFIKPDALIGLAPEHSVLTRKRVIEFSADALSYFPIRYEKAKPQGNLGYKFFSAGY